MNLHGLIFVILTFRCQYSLCARILGFFPVPSISHQLVFRALTQELARRGHEIVIVTPFPAFSKNDPQSNITEIDVYNVSYKFWQESFQKIADLERKGKRSLVQHYEILMDSVVNIFDSQLQDPEVKKIIDNPDEQFDLILIEMMARVAHSLRHRFKVPVIAVSSLSGFVTTFDLIGSPTNPAYYIDFLSKKAGNLDFIDKIQALIPYLRQKYFDLSHLVKRYNHVARKHFGEDTPDIEELESQMDMLFLNANPIWDSTRPVPPSVVYIGGAYHVKPPLELPLDLKMYLDNSSQGVVYMSLGSNIKSVDLREDRLRVFLNVFGRLSYNIIWKWESDQLPGKPNNVLISKWLPQQDILRHKNVKAFITQAGLQSTDEAIHSGIPVIGVPFMGDQEHNAAKFELHGVGISLDIATLTENELESAIKSIIHDTSYRENMQRMSRLMADQPTTGMERAVWWTEHVLRHGGGRHLRSPTAGVSFVQYFMLDIIAVVLLALILSICTVTFVIKKCMVLYISQAKIKKH